MNSIPAFSILLALSIPLLSQETSFASRIDGESMVTKLTADRFSNTVSPSLYKEENGEIVWTVAASVTEKEAALTAIGEARRVLGDRYGSNWTLREAGRHVSGYNGKYFHHYRFEFRPKSGAENLQIIVTLDGRIIPTTRNK